MSKFRKKISFEEAASQRGQGYSATTGDIFHFRVYESLPENFVEIG